MSDDNSGNTNGSWEEIAVVNATGNTPQQLSANQQLIRSALFGGGTQASSLIQHVFVGDKEKSGETLYNKLPVIRKVLGKLGIPVGNSNAHENHFHIDFRTPSMQPIVSSLLAEDSLINANGVNSMFDINLPMAFEKNDTVLVIAKNTDGRHVAGGCQAVRANIGTNQISDFLDPITVAQEYLYRYTSLKSQVQQLKLKAIELLTHPNHGTISIKGSLEDQSTWYTPNKNYTGDDTIYFDVVFETVKVRVFYLLKVTTLFTDSSSNQEKLCKKTGLFWKVSSHQNQETSIDSNMDVSIILEDGIFSIEIFDALVSSIKEKNQHILNKGIATANIIKRPTLGSAVIKNGQLLYTPKKEGIDTVILKVKTNTGAIVIYSVNIEIDSAGEASYKIINFSDFALISNRGLRHETHQIN